jgi:uncharacterized protein
LADFVCDTSPLQYLHQLRHLDLLRSLATAVFVPPAVADEISRGIALGVDLPDLTSLHWMRPCKPNASGTQQWPGKLGLGELEVLQLAIEMPGSLVLMDDRLARRSAASLNLPLKGTIGLLIDAKRAGLLSEIRPLLDRLDLLGFRLTASSRATAVRLAGETPLTKGNWRVGDAVCFRVRHSIGHGRYCVEPAELDRLDPTKYTIERAS